MKTYADPEAQAEIDRLRAELDRLRKVLLAEWEKDRKTYAALMEAVRRPSLPLRDLRLTATVDDEPLVDLDHYQPGDPS